MPRSKKRKHKRPRQGLPTAARIEKALRENRSQQALELAKVLYKQQANGHHRELLKRAIIARAKDLTSRGCHRDAGVVLTQALQLDESPAFHAEVACQLAKSGDISQALELREQITDPNAQQNILNFAADECVRLGRAAKSSLPVSLHEEFKSILQAFALSESGDDDQARSRLAGIGLRSPFLEWKLLLRGMLAYYASDDARAIENWQRLDAHRWPFRLAAPMRFAIDPEFRKNQTPETLNALQKQMDQFQGAGLAQKLRILQPLLTQERTIPQALSQAEQILPRLKTEAPALASRLASCFHWALVDHGCPEDLKRYRKIFGAPAEDPDMSRFEALALERCGEFTEAHKTWQCYEKTIADNPAWPDEQKNRVRSLIWQHMGSNAEDVPEFDDDMLPPFFMDNIGRKPKPLKPSAAECYEQSIKLAPQQMTSHEALFEHLLKSDKLKQAENAGKRLLKQFPDHVPSMEKLGDLCMELEKHSDALKLFDRASQANPLEHRLRNKLGNAYLYHARQHVEKGAFDEARTAFQTAINLDTRGKKYPVLCKWAACEFKAGDAARGEELLQQAHSELGARLAIVFSFLIETIRYKLTKLKPRINKEFNSLLAEAPTAAAASALAETAASHRAAGVKYYGQQTHEKKVTAYLERSRQAEFTEQEMRSICNSLALLHKPTLHLSFIKLGQTRFEKSPYFFLAEAEYESDRGPYGYNMWRIPKVLEQARKLAENMPRSDEQQELLQRIQKCEAASARFTPFGRLFGDPFGDSPFDFYDDDIDDDYDDYDDDDFF